MDALSVDLAGMQREVKRMARANSRIILMRLSEEWGDSTDAAALYKELEMDKKRWMLAALDKMDKGMDERAVSEKAMAKSEKILALFETQGKYSHLLIHKDMALSNLCFAATTSYLAALYPKSLVYHLSSQPLSHVLFSNIRPLLSPAVSASSLSVAPALFTQAFCLSMPSLLPSADIPQFLRTIRRSLTPDGVLHLNLIDALPVASSMGPKMRAWFEENLQFNLERRFLCMNPTKLFPAWLSDAGLHGDGSTIAAVKHFALLPPVPAPSGMASDYGASQSSAGDVEDVERELRTLVGKMLWQEVWGPYVTAQNWFWEDPECARECRKLGTYWEYKVIAAKKIVET